MCDAIIIRYGEISLKGKNRSHFEGQLKRDVEMFLQKIKVAYGQVVIRRGRLYVLDIKKCPPLHQVFGIYSYSPARVIARKFDVLLEEAKKYIDRTRAADSFRVSCQRVDKRFSITSVEVERLVGEVLFEATRTPVHLAAPDFNLEVEIGQDSIYLFTERIRGFGGLPFGSAGKLVSLISSGIDSPIATFLMMKRGAEPILLHYQITPEDAKKVRQLKKQLEEYTAGRKLKLVTIKRDKLFKGHFDELYNDRNYHSYMCIFCKYLMHQKAGEIAAAEEAYGLITGDNLAQVASQTLKNLQAYRLQSGYPVYSPLISFEKQETIKIAKQIGTYEISIQKAYACEPPKTPKTGVNQQIFQRLLKKSGLG